MKAPDGLHIRTTLIDGIGPWMWREADHWAWEHPRSEWPALRDLTLSHAKQKRVIIQAGGCMGMYPRLWSEHFETVYTFEPDPINFYCLVANCPSERIVKMQAGLSNECRFGSFEPGPKFNAGMGKTTDEAGCVPLLSLDALNFPVVDAIQLDCEGHEDWVISGALGTLSRHRPLLSIERPSDGLRKTIEQFGYTEAGRCGTMPDVVFTMTS